MGREILFRGKRKENGKWVEGYYQQRYDAFENIQHLIFLAKSSTVWEYAEVDPETVCQYTGLTDKNGRKIFEGDILFVVEKMGSDVFQNGILINSPRWVNKTKFKVEFTPGGLMNVQRFCNSKDIECELIGNIFDNQELLNQ